MSTVIDRIHAKCEQAKARIDAERGRIPGGVPAKEEAPAEPVYEPWPVNAAAGKAQARVNAFAWTR